MTSTTRAFEGGRKALVGYWPAGFPDVDASIDAVRTMVAAGCDVIEVGLPYSDPVMDGGTVQAAAQQALEAGVRTRDVFRVVEAASGAGAPTVVMTYWNPVDRYGVDRFAADLAAAGGAGLITPDLTPDSGGDWIRAADAHDLDKVFLVAPSSTDERLRMTVEACRGFVYATAVMGVTGVRSATSDLAEPLVRRAKRLTDLPVGVGLGVSTGDQAAEVAGFADAVIVGSAFIKPYLEASDRESGLTALRDKVAELAAGVARVRG